MIIAICSVVSTTANGLEVIKTMIMPATTSKSSIPSLTASVGFAGAHYNNRLFSLSACDAACLGHYKLVVSYLGRRRSLEKFRENLKREKYLDPLTAETLAMILSTDSWNNVSGRETLGDHIADIE